MKRPPARQLDLPIRTHGGRRAGAGRKPNGRRAGAPHQARPQHNHRRPVHVTLRVVSDVGNLRRRDCYAAIRRATLVTARRADFRIVHLSIQRDHLHLIVEAQDTGALSCGVRGFAISAARRINQAFDRRGGWRSGRVIQERYHARPLTTPREVRNAISYTLNNWRHHGEDRGRHWLVDPFSSGAVYPDWKELEDAAVMWPLPATYDSLFVFRPQTWLLQHWSRLHPLISAREVPAGRRR